MVKKITKFMLYVFYYNKKKKLSEKDTMLFAKLCIFLITCSHIYSVKAFMRIRFSYLNQLGNSPYTKR